ncbi:hypothetical protein KQX54_016448 [Cotesia glomerata]|uniref:Uncharacterized protein n=1 Tax=Cotesia glomerata TaxID=32391 RepID=A0AAV7HYA4_COTGL|nr:hypothetical protein KQX54_016448 [Cotesia glomerata]
MKQDSLLKTKEQNRGTQCWETGLQGRHIKIQQFIIQFMTSYQRTTSGIKSKGLILPSPPWSPTTHRLSLFVLFHPPLNRQQEDCVRYRVLKLTAGVPCETIVKEDMRREDLVGPRGISGCFRATKPVSEQRTEERGWKEKESLR